MKIALFGGAFDPPHLGHQKVADTLISQQLVQEVWFVPVFKHPWAKRMNKEQLSRYDDRVAMLQLLISHSLHPDKQKVAHYRDVSFTYDQLEHFSQENPDDEFHWVMGSEYLPKFGDFLSLHPKLIQYPIYIYPRAGHPMSPLDKNMTALTGVETIKVSSTQVRDKVRAGKAVETLVGSEVARYITTKQLYATIGAQKPEL